MMPAALRHLRRTPALRTALIAGLVVAAAIVVLVLWLLGETAERRAIRELAPEERAELYRRELATFETLCGRGPRDDALQERCEAEARFLQQFPECDDECRALADSHLQGPRR